VINTIRGAHDDGLRRAGAGSTVFARDFAHVDVGASPVIDDLRTMAGVTGVAVLRRQPDPASTTPSEQWRDPTVVSCAELATVPGVGSCATSSVAASIDFNPGGAIVGDEAQQRMRWPAATLSEQQLAALPVHELLVATDGTRSAVERVRTALEIAYPLADVPNTIGSWSPVQLDQQDQYRQLAFAIIVGGLLVAGCTLAVAAVGGIVERRRAFSLLRLTGVSLADLRRVVILESALPLIAAVAGTVVVGFLSTDLFLRAQLHQSVRSPGLGFLVALLLGGGASLAIIAATLPLLARVTGPATARNE
jgi:hypothetical protein